jgi:hypothetical protein
MAKFASLIIPSGADFFEICRLTDKVQGNATSHLLKSDDIKRTLELFQLVKNYGKKVYVTCQTSYSFKGFRFKSVCTRLTLTKEGGSLSRVEAPEAPEECYGKDSKFIIVIEQSNNFPLCDLTSIRREGFFLWQSDDNALFFRSNQRT